jgi:hypothetical protein
MLVLSDSAAAAYEVLAGRSLAQTNDDENGTCRGHYCARKYVPRSFINQVSLKDFPTIFGTHKCIQLRAFSNGGPKLWFL